MWSLFPCHVVVFVGAVVVGVVVVGVVVVDVVVVDDDVLLLPPRPQLPRLQQLPQPQNFRRPCSQRPWRGTSARAPTARALQEGPAVGVREAVRHLRVQVRLGIVATEQ